MGRALAGWDGQVWIVTAFAGFPAEQWVEADGTVSVVTPFDRGCGFTRSLNAVTQRRREDAIACGELGQHVHPIHAGFLDGQYDDLNGVTLDKLTAWCARWMRDTPTLLVPLGIVHPDHMRLALAARMAIVGMLRERAFRVIVYADQPSSTLWPDEIGGGLVAWKTSGFTLNEMDPSPTDHALEMRKHRAVHCYGSQVHLPELQWPNVRDERAWLAEWAG